MKQQQNRIPSIKQQNRTMSRSVREYLKLNRTSFILVEFRFVRCKIMMNGNECYTYEWMDSNLWKELMEGTKELLQIYNMINKFSTFEPTTTSTPNLKLACILKENLIKTHIFLEPSRSNKDCFESVSKLKGMLVISVTLNKPGTDLQELHDVLSLYHKERQLKISSYFA
ncbi:uncharacterized protein LOC116928430 isoform X3 [Daphnia magna]|uniref:Uncharacterized protein n=1 Tax=Daphnia magna TaxID=35525 RepID=A0A164T0Z8_9CRUS|nr:uncharacterized protein LOC116928430 isoform X3 [Daphnia magna]KZS10122.1 Uncharacterized protein APZ42_025487 [Daphnia magna]